MDFEGEMSVTIAMIGLGQIGASIGLALKGRVESLTRVGYDSDRETSQKALKLGVCDRLEMSPPAAVRTADVVLLSVPISQLPQTFQAIADSLKEGAVIVDTGPLKEVTEEWARQYLPQHSHYVGVTPVIHSRYLYHRHMGIDAARQDLFQGSLVAIASSASTSAKALKLVADLTHLLGATPFFVDITEMDGLMSATHFLPQLIAAALLNATVEEPGWREARKVAGRGYAEVTSPIVTLDDPSALKTSLVLNRKNMLRVVDNVIAALEALRADINTGNEQALEERLNHARKSREKWWRERQSASWAEADLPFMELPKPPGVIERLFGFGHWKRKEGE